MVNCLVSSQVLSIKTLRCTFLTAKNYNSQSNYVAQPITFSNKITLCKFQLPLTQGMTTGSKVRRNDNLTLIISDLREDLGECTEWLSPALETYYTKSTENTDPCPPTPPPPTPFSRIAPSVPPFPKVLDLLVYKKNECSLYNYLLAVWFWFWHDNHSKARNQDKRNDCRCFYMDLRQLV